MLKNRIMTLVAAGSLAISAVASADIITRTANFDNADPNGDPQQGWTFGVFPPGEGIETIGNNKYLAALVDNWGVTLYSKRDGTNAWVGDKNYRDEGVVGLSMVFAGTAQFDTARKLTIFIMTDNGTPNDVLDDYGYFHTINKWYIFLGKPRKFGFLIPSWVTGDAPDGWFPYAVDGEPPKDINWDDVITDVDRMNVGLWQPDFFYIFQQHDVAVDNIKLYIDTDRRK